MKHSLCIRHSVHLLLLVLHLLLGLLLDRDVGEAVLVLVTAARHILLLSEALPILRLGVLRVQRALVANIETFYVRRDTVMIRLLHVEVVIDQFGEALHLLRCLELLWLSRLAG